MQVKISFWNPEKYKSNFIKIFNINTYDLYFKVENHPIAELWIKKLEDALSVDFILESRWPCFNLKGRSKEDLIEKLKKCINIINNSWLNTDYNYFIDPINDDYTVEEHNRIHHHFEILMGQTWNPSNWWKIILKSMDKKLMNAVRGLNDISHEIDALKISNPCLHLLFNDEKIIREDLPIESENYFTLNVGFGDVLLHYAQLGKTWVEVVLDNDDIIFEENINPLRLISGEFDISFNMFFNEKNYNNLKKNIEKGLKKLGKNINDKSLRLGNIIVAKIISNDNEKNIIKNLQDNNQVYSISIIDDNFTPEILKSSRIFKPYYDPY